MNKRVAAGCPIHLAKSLSTFDHRISSRPAWVDLNQLRKVVVA